MPSNILIFYTQERDKAKVTSVPNSDSYQLGFTRDLENGCAVIDADQLPPPLLWEYDIMIFLAHGMLLGSNSQKRGVMSATGGKGQCSGMKVCNSSIVRTIRRHNPKFIIFIACHMGCGSTFKSIYDELDMTYPISQTCLLCGHTDATPFLRDIPLTLFGNRFYGRYKDGELIDSSSSVPPKELRMEFEAYKKRNSKK